MARSVMIDIPDASFIPGAINQVVQDVAAEIASTDWSRSLEDQLPFLQQVHQDYFDRATGPDQQAWPSLSSETVRRKGNSKILVNTRRLVQSLSANTADSVQDINSATNTLTFGTRVPYSIFHQGDCGGRFGSAGAAGSSPKGRRQSRLRLPRQPGRSRRSHFVFGAVGAIRGLLSRLFGRTHRQMNLPNLKTTTSRLRPIQKTVRRRKTRATRPHVGLNLDSTRALAGRIADAIVERLGR